MRCSRTAIPVLIVSLLAAPAALTVPADPVAQAAAAPLAMSTELRQLFIAEMRELAGGVQTIAGALPGGDWQVVANSAGAIRASYVLNKQLTKAQAAELEALPERFKALDEAFHARAGKLVAAANARDAEAASFQFSRLLESCVACHAAFAPARFPGLQAPHAEHHH